MASDYDRIIERIFQSKYKGATTRTFRFSRDDIIDAAKVIGVKRPKNIGDVPYSFRYRRRLPSSILDTCPQGKEWVIRGVETARDEYEFVLLPATNITPNPGLVEIKVPDSTPEIVRRYSLSDEQALLAILRYNRLLDIFTGITTYSLQNHLRTTVGKQQIEVDELYVGVGRSGAQYVLPVQAKGGRDELGRVQLEQDLRLCGEKYPHLVCRAIAAQFMDGDVIALFELTVDKKDVVRIVEERHYRLVPADEIDDDELDKMGRAARP